MCRLTRQMDRSALGFRSAVGQYSTADGSADKPVWEYKAVFVNKDPYQKEA